MLTLKTAEFLFEEEWMVDVICVSDETQAHLQGRQNIDSRMVGGLAVSKIHHNTEYQMYMYFVHEKFEYKCSNPVNSKGSFKSVKRKF